MRIPGFVQPLLCLSLIFAGCGRGLDEHHEKHSGAPTEKFKEYWYSGEAEITSYELKQARYGEIREGTATLIFVTEDFLKHEQVKAEEKSRKTISVLKLNSTKSFNTGIYPYSIMESTFFPVNCSDHAFKVTASVQEWCGQTYTQINNRGQFDVLSHSYFEEEGDQFYEIPGAHLENEIWNQIRINPKDLPTGEIRMIPSLEFGRLKHVKLKPYSAEAEITTSDSLNSYTINYPALERELKIFYNNSFPYEIKRWEETFVSGFGDKAEKLTTTAKKMQRIKSAYWNKNSNNDLPLREKLNLD